MSTPEPPDFSRHRRLLEILADVGPTTVPEVAARLEAHPVTVERQCLELQRAGRIRQCTGGKLVLADDGSTASNN
ncbi:hypothetical protein [Natrarchaeobaculum aegyptiacum]|uniref:DprA winged helix domain-containing protein n=1 Tax=Natrarchaeobaculum aegyptiacum TaxID=745377 RepID=A0A2Z2HVA4_9EURY|nr:hypothetical protein [Natrarchaeobaculum aegyptiacum]ARS91142.1 hypothetical protein B1756_16355 [Natrarchaeobaculum aegyptiacum]